MSSVAKKKVDVTLQTDVADLEIPSEAWKSMADAAKNDSIVIAVQENKTDETVTSWTVTAKAGTTDVFTAADARRDHGDRGRTIPMRRTWWSTAPTAASRSR